MRLTVLQRGHDPLSAGKVGCERRCPEKCGPEGPEPRALHRSSLT
jgi:hypothetical protein